jgi:hypothetical protein
MKLETLHAFRDEIEKSAAMPASLVRAGRFLSESPGRTALIGAGVGALGGAATADEGDRLHGALRGALGGAAVGGAVGGAGRAYRDTHLLSKQPLSTGEAVVGTVKRLGEGAVRFGKRQIHGLTGAYADPAQTGIRSSVEAARRSELVEKRLADRLKDVADPAHAQKLREGAQKELHGLKEWGQQGDAALKAGVTSIPGVARGLATKGKRVETLKALGHEMTGGGGLMSVGGALGVGLPAATGVADLARGDESAQGGRTIRQKAVGLGTNLGVGALTAGMPFGAQLVASSAADAVGQRLARGRAPVPGVAS